MRSKRSLCRFVVSVALPLLAVCSTAKADTITFDDVPPQVVTRGTVLHPNVQFIPGGPDAMNLRIANGAAEGVAPNSGANYLAQFEPNLNSFAFRFIIGDEAAAVGNISFYIVGPASGQNAGPWTIQLQNQNGVTLRTVTGTETNFLFTATLDNIHQVFFFRGALGQGIDTLTFGAVAPAVPTPEPTTLLLLGTGLAGLIGAAKRRRPVRES